MRILPFLLGSGWSIPWHLLFYLATVPTLIFLSLLRRNRKREAMLLSYAVGSVLLLIFSSIHTLLFTLSSQVRPLMKYPTAALTLFLFCMVAWSVIPYLMQGRRIMKVAMVHLLIGLIVYANLWSLWQVQVQRLGRTIHAEKHIESKRIAY